MACNRPELGFGLDGFGTWVGNRSGHESRNRRICASVNLSLEHIPMPQVRRWIWPPEMLERSAKRSGALGLSVLILVAIVCWLGGSAPIAIASDRPPAVVVWHAVDAPEDYREVSALLREAGFDVTGVRTLAELRAARADLLLVRGSERLGASVHGDEWERLPQDLLSGLFDKRVIGIGWDAARLFELMGAEIRTENMASPTPTRDTLLVDPSASTRERGSPRKVSMREPGVMSGTGEARRAQYMRVPREGPLSTALTVIARLVGAPVLAPIVRQQNLLHFGMASDARAWSAEYRELWKMLVAGMLNRPIAKFEPMRWKESPVGEHKFVLSPGGGDSGGNERTFYFRFDASTVVSAELLQSGSDSVLLSMRADLLPRLRDIDEVRGGQQRPLRILMPITSKRLRRPPNPYWALRVSNFDVARSARCTLVVRLESTDVRIDESVVIALERPAVSASLCESLVARVTDADTFEQLRVQAALIVIGVPALAPLRGAALRAPVEVRVRLNRIIYRIEDQ